MVGKTAQSACGYCCGPLPESPTVIADMAPGPDVGGDTYTAPARQVKIALCDECRGLRRYGERSTWNHIVGEPIASRYRDDELHEAAKDVPIRPFFETGRSVADPDAKPWSHINPVDARIALSGRAIERMAPDDLAPHPTGRPCGSCGAIETPEWLPGLYEGWPCCSECDGCLQGDFAQGRRIQRLFADELKPSLGAVHFVAGDVLRAFADTEAKASNRRWGYVTPADKNRLRRHLVEINHPLVPDQWRKKYAKAESAPAPVTKRKTVGAVGV